MTGDCRHEVQCFCCGETSRQSLLLDAQEFGSREFDDRRNETFRFITSNSLQECPACGYVAVDISEGDDRDRLFVQTENYAALREGPPVSRRSSRFLLRAAIDVARDDFERAFVNTLCAAQDADNCALEEVASGLRKIAGRYLRWPFRYLPRPARDVTACAQASLLVSVRITFPPSLVARTSSRVALALAVMLALAPWAPSIGATRSPLLGMHIQKVMQEFGLPDGFKMLPRGAKAYEWHPRAAAEILTTQGERRTEDLFCTVTISVSRRELVTAVKTEVSSVTASLYASTGAFGCLCADSFGMKRERKPSCKVPRAPI